jgi:hypothetical protein
MKKIKNKNESRRRSSEAVSGKSLSTNKYYRSKATNPTVQSRLSLEKSSYGLSFSKFINFSIGLLVIVVVFFASTLSTTPAISIKNSAPKYRDQIAYTNFASDYLQRSLVSQSKLLFRSADFEQAMRQEFPEIDQISAIIPLGGRKLDVNMTLSTPLAIVMNGSEKGIVDSTGTLVTTNVNRLLIDSQNDSLPQLRFSTPQDNFSSGSVLLTSTEIELLQLILSELQSADLVIDSAGSLQVSEFLFNVSDGQLEVRFTGQPFYVKYSVYTDVRVQVGTMVQTFKQLNREGQFPTSYIDVRVPEKVYVK